MSEQRCRQCGRKVADQAVICPACAEQLERDLGDVAALTGGRGTSESGLPLALVDELQVTYTRQSVGSRSGGGKKSKADMQDGPLTWDDRAAKAARALRTSLVGWVRITQAERGTAVLEGPAQRGEPWPLTLDLAGPVDDTLQSMAALLLRNLPWWRRRDDVADLAADIARVVASVRIAVDRAPDRVFVGPCMAQITVEDEVTECVADLYAEVGDKIVTCRVCKAEHDVEKRRDYLIRLSEDLLLHAAWIAQALSGFGYHLQVERIYQWASRGQLLAHGVDMRGRPTYRVGDVIELLDADVKRAAKREARRGASA